MTRTFDTGGLSDHLPETITTKTQPFQQNESAAPSRSFAYDLNRNSRMGDCVRFRLALSGEPRKLLTLSLHERIPSI
jgi:hypothetical protein